MSEQQLGKPCKHCGGMMPKDSNICPYCQRKQKKNNWLIVMIIVIAIPVYLVSCGTILGIFGSEEEPQSNIDISGHDSESQEENKQENDNLQHETDSKEDDVNKFEYTDTSIKYLRSEIEYNSFDEKCLFVYFEFTNNSDENKAFDYLVECKAFQNGVELETNYIYDCDEERNGTKEIQPGASVTVAEIFKLGDSMENVTLEVRPFNIWSDRLLFEKEIQITE